MASLFPGNIGKEESNKRKALAMRYLDIVTQVPRGQVRTTELGMLREEFPAAPATEDGDNTIHFDLCKKSARARNANISLKLCWSLSLGLSVNKSL